MQKNNRDWRSSEEWVAVDELTGPRRWHPEKNPSPLVGTFQDVQLVKNNNGNDFEIYILREDDGRETSVAAFTDLKRQMQHVKQGERVKIEALGTYQTRDTEGFKFEVSVSRNRAGSKIIFAEPHCV